VADTARDLLAAVERARAHVRARRRGASFALRLFGVLVLASAPLYIAREVWTRSDGSSLWVSGGWYASLYWLIAVPLGYVECLRYYRRHAERTGIAGATWPWIATGLGLFALMLLVPPGLPAAWLPTLTPGWASLPLVALAGGFLVLSWLERNPYLAALSVALFVVPPLCEWVYSQFFGWRRFSGIGFSMIVTGVMLVCAGVIGWNRERGSGERRSAAQ
jgi:hypothetical protein